jgi:hypothetical protein
MAQILIGVNMEFVRHQDKNFEWGVEKAAVLDSAEQPPVHSARAGSAS